MTSNTEKDWNITDGYKPEERLYVKPAPHAVRALYLTSAITIPASQLQDAYVLDEEAEEGFTMVRLPNFDNVRVRVRNTDIVFHTFESNKTYTSRLEIGDLFRYKDSSSTSAEEIVPAAPEWLNNLCNRIDALEAQVETLNEWTVDMKQIVKDEMEDFDIHQKIRDEVKDYLHNEFDFTDAIDDGLSNYDLAEKVQEAIDEMDHKEMVSDVIARYDFKNIVMSIIDSPEFTHMVWNTVRQQTIRFISSEKAIKDLTNGNDTVANIVNSTTPLFYRDKGWNV